jgi:hypothetical protein
VSELVVGRIEVLDDGTRMLAPLDVKHRVQVLDHQQRVAQLVEAAYAYRDDQSEENLRALAIMAILLD